MAMHLGRTTAAFSRVLSGFAVAPPAARHLCTSALNQAPKQRFFPSEMLVGASTIWIFGAACILDYKLGWDVTGKWKSIRDEMDLEREKLNECLKELQLQRKEMAKWVEEREKREKSNGLLA